MWPNPSNFTPLPVKQFETWVKPWCSSSTSLIPPILPRFTRCRCGHNLNDKREGQNPSFPYFLHGMAVVSSQGEDLAEEGPWSCLSFPLAVVLVPLGLCKCGIKELERKGSRGTGSIMEQREVGVRVLPQLKPHSGDPSPSRGRRRRDVGVEVS